MVTDNTSHSVLTSTYTVEQLQVGMDVEIYPQGLHFSWGRREGGAGSQFNQAAVFRKGNYSSKMGGGVIYVNPSEVTPTVHVSSHPWQTSSTRSITAPKRRTLGVPQLMHQQLGRPLWHRWVFASSPPFTKSGTARTNTGTLMNNVRHREHGRLGGKVSEDTMWSLGQKKKKPTGRGKLKSSLESLIKMCKFCRCSVRWPGLGKQLVYSFTICLWSRDNWIDKLLLPGQL